MNYGNFLNFKDLLVNEIAGSILIFLIISLIIIFWLCARFRFELDSTLFILLAWILIISPVLSYTLFGITIFVIGIIFATKITRLMQR